jgi:nucleotide-binding universal stress UspA family protein
MTTITIPERLFARRLLVPTDLGPDGDRALAHALRIVAAIPEQSSLTVLHVGGNEDDAKELMAEMPSVRAPLERWGLIPAESSRSAVQDLGFSVNKVIAEQRGTAATILAYTMTHGVDLLVVGTRGDEGLPHWLARSVSETVADNIAAPTLFVPRNATGFVDVETGAVTMRRVLCPIDWEPHPARAVSAAIAAAAAFGDGNAEVVLFHVGPEDDQVPLALPEVEGVSYRWVSGEGDVVDAILAEANREPTDLITMVTTGRDNFRDSLRGTDTEQVIRRAPCPVLAAPVLGTD